MRLKRIKIVLVAAPMTLCVLGVAAAQTGSGILQTPPSATVEAGREVDVPPPQQLATGQQSLARMEQGATTVRTALEQARSARDVVKTLCLTDKLNQLDVAIRSAKDRLLSLKSAADSGDKDRSRHELMILLALRDRGSQLSKEANQCIGEEAGFIGQQELTLTVDPNIPDNNPDQLGMDPDPISPPPVLSSPTFAN